MSVRHGSNMMCCCWGKVLSLNYILTTTERERERELFKSARRRRERAKIRREGYFLLCFQTLSLSRSLSSSNPPGSSFFSILKAGKRETERQRDRERVYEAFLNQNKKLSNGKVVTLYDYSRRTLSRLNASKRTSHARARLFAFNLSLRISFLFSLSLSLYLSRVLGRL